LTKKERQEMFGKAKKFNVTIEYPEMRKALKEAGWLEVRNRDFDDELDCKFTFGQADINFKSMKKGCWIN
jgi:hypothetical protein